MKTEPQNPHEASPLCRWKAARDGRRARITGRKAHDAAPSSPPLARTLAVLAQLNGQRPPMHSQLALAAAAVLAMKGGAA